MNLHWKQIQIRVRNGCLQCTVSTLISHTEAFHIVPVCSLQKSIYPTPRGANDRSEFAGGGKSDSSRNNYEIQNWLWLCYIQTINIYVYLKLTSDAFRLKLSSSCVMSRHYFEYLLVVMRYLHEINVYIAGNASLPA